MSVDEGGWRWQADIIRRQFPHNTIVSGFRNNSVAAGGSGGDYHSRGRAIDVGGPNLMAVFDWLVATYPQSAEVIYSPANARQIKDGRAHLYGEPTRSGHFTHVHWAIIGPTQVGAAFPTGGITGSAGGGGSGVGTATSATSAGSSLFSFFTNAGIWSRAGLAILAAILLFFATRATMKATTA